MASRHQKEVSPPKDTRMQTNKFQALMLDLGEMHYGTLVGLPYHKISRRQTRVIHFLVNSFLGATKGC